MKKPRNIDALLRSMDAATDSPPPEPVRAGVDLDRILSHAPTTQQTSTPETAAGVRTSAPQRPSRRTIAVGATVAAVTAVLLVAPSLTGGDPAFATWTPTPVTLNEAARGDAVAECRASGEEVSEGMYKDDLATAQTAIAERRGDWVTVVLAGAGGFDATCITDASAPWFRQGMIGAIGKSGTGTGPKPRELAVSQLGTGSVGGNPISMASGAAGSDITGITYTSVSGEQVTATVSLGHFAFWMPGDELQNASETGAAVDVTYSDGTTDTQRLNF
jgi:hypothetical protein